MNMIPLPKTAHLSDLPYTSSFTEEQFRQYEQRLLPNQSSEKLRCHQDSLGGDTIIETVQETGRRKERQESESTVPATQKSEISGVTHLPGKRQIRPIRVVRHTIFNVYRRLFSIVLIANVIALVVYLLNSSGVLRINIWNLATASSANIFVASAIRQDYVQGLLYRCAWLIPHSASLKMRRIIAKLYENGGIHSGCGIAATMWFLALTVLAAIQFSHGVFTSRPLFTLTCCLQALLFVITISAYPALRTRYHNNFEMSHRFAGWIVIIVFWVELSLLATATANMESTSTGGVLAKQPSFWFLISTTFHAILPWVNLRRWEFQADHLSNHAIRLHFSQTVSPFTGIAISRSPLFEWHPFATMPSLAGEPTGGSLICSAAGDWTKDAVKNPRRYYWVKGIPKPGVLGMCLIFKQVVVVTTGSGIGPCLSILASPIRKTACRVLWSGPDPEKTFGSEITDCVRRVDPRAVIIDTKASGRPDMLALTYSLYLECNAEAVFVISNPKLTRKIVYGMECRGVPAFGPIWDS